MTFPTPKKNLEKGCPHCGGDIAVRNPSGYCDHLYYPDNCKICAHWNEGAAYSPTTQKTCCDKCTDDPSGNDYSFNERCRNPQCPCHSQKTLQTLIDNAVVQFDQYFAYQDKVQDAIPLAMMHDRLRIIFQTIKDASYWQGARDAIAAVEVEERTERPAIPYTEGWNACQDEQQRRATLFLKDQNK